MIPGIESLACGPLAVPEDVMAHVVHVESSRNPFAIGVVGGRLLRQPRNLGEAVATVRMLEARGFNYSIGLAQVNRVNFARFGLDTPEAGFDVCNNLAAGASILAECLQRHDGRWGDAFSCYYSGNARTGYEHGYVQKVFDAMASGAPSEAPAEAIAFAPGPAPGGAQAGVADASSTSWDAVYTARITAPDATRVDAVTRVQPFGDVVREPLVAYGAMDARSMPVDAAGDRHAAIADAQGGTSALPSTPEARFVAEMQQLAVQGDGQGGAAVAPVAAAVPMPSPVRPEPVAGVPASGDAAITQKQSNSSGLDAARVF
jgi:type IV secretion system protein VirB1